MPPAPATIAVIFDFDDTLVPDSTSLLLQQHGIDPTRFWKEEAKALVDKGYDPSHAYLRLILDNVGKGKRLGKLTNASLRKFGSSLNKHFFPGIPTLFRDLRKIVAKVKDVGIDFYVISGGLQEIIEGCELIQKNMSGVYGCQLGGETETSELKYIKRCVTFTEKTRFLFEINKGLEPSATQKNPYLVNEDIPPHSRRVPFKNMIYVGDGLTDIPCFSLLKNLGGTPFGVFKPDMESAKRALLKFLTPHRVVSMHTPKYGKRDDFGVILRAAVTARSTQIELERSQAEPVG